MKVLKQRGCSKSSIYEDSVSERRKRWKRLRVFHLDGRESTALQDAIADIQARDRGAWQ